MIYDNIKTNHKGDMVMVETKKYGLKRTFTKQGSVYSLAISPDGQKIVKGGYSGKVYETIKIWNIHTGERLDEFKEALEFKRSSFSMVGLPIDTMTEHTQSIRSIAISPNGQFLVSGSEDKTVKVWDLSSGQLYKTLTDHSSYVYSVAIAHDGKIFASASATDGTINIWSLQDHPELLRSLKSGYGQVTCIATSSDGETLVSNKGGNTIEIWNYNTGDFLGTLAGHAEYVHALAITSDGRTLVSGSSDKTIKVWNLPDRQLIGTLTGHTGAVTSVAISTDGQTLVSGGGSGDNTVKVWALQTGKLLETLPGHTQTIESVVFSPTEDIFATGGWDGEIRIWRKNGGSMTEQLSQAFERAQQLPEKVQNLLAEHLLEEIDARRWE